MTATLAYRGYTAAELVAMPRVSASSADLGHHADKPKYKPTTLSAFWLPERTFAVPKDADYAAPTNWSEAHDLMTRFPKLLQVIFSVIAAERCLWRWEAWASWAAANPRPTKLHGWKVVAPRKAIEATREWINAPTKMTKAAFLIREARRKKVREAATNVNHANSITAYAENPTLDAARAACASVDTASAVSANDTYAAVRVANAVDFAASAAYAAAAYAADAAYRDELSAWWQECRARFAVAMPDSAKLEGWQ